MGYKQTFVLKQISKIAKIATDVWTKCFGPFQTISTSAVVALFDIWQLVWYQFGIWYQGFIALWLGALNSFW